MRVAVSIILLACSVHAQIASGGPFSLSQSAVAGGGRTSSNGPFMVEATVGQSAAGGPSQAGPYNVYAGFWTPAPLAPTAAFVGISGRVLTSNGQGIRGAYITLTGGDGISQIAISSSLGHYSFSEVVVGDTYMLTISGSRHVFPQPTIVLHVIDQLENVDFIAAP